MEPDFDSFSYEGAIFPICLTQNAKNSSSCQFLNTCGDFFGFLGA